VVWRLRPWRASTSRRCDELGSRRGFRSRQRTHAAATCATFFAAMRTHTFLPCKVFAVVYVRREIGAICSSFAPAVLIAALHSSAIRRRRHPREDVICREVRRCTRRRLR
jgi:hypothetical protein